MDGTSDTCRQMQYETRYEMSLIYIEEPYRTAIGVTVRRNLVYNLRSLLPRDAKGRVCVGIYFPVVLNPADAQVTLLRQYQRHTVQAEIKVFAV